MSFKGIVTVGCWLMLASLFAANISGVISDAETQAPLADVRVILPESNEMRTTDAHGKFLFTHVDDGEYQLQLQRLGYAPQSLRINTQDAGLRIAMDVMPQSLDGLWVKSTRARLRETPVTFSQLSSQEIARKNGGQDISLLMGEMPNIMAYTETGSGVGYSHIKIRGFDEKRIGVMINGIPLNDPEDHNVYWVNMPDFAESVQDIQVQRGVGSSLYGVSSFGGSINVATMPTRNGENSNEIFVYGGSYNTQKIGLKSNYNLSEHLTASVRASVVQSDGYRENSASKHWALFASLSHFGERSRTDLNIYTGHEETHASWNASEAADLAENHQHNPITYDNEIDDFSQPHFELHHAYFLNPQMDLKNTLFYIRGDGFYEQFKEGRDLWEYGLADTEETVEADLIRQKYVIKNQYGWVGEFQWRHPRGTFTGGSYISLFDSDHWGEVEKVFGADTMNIGFQSGHEYYRYAGEKRYLTFYFNENYQLNRYVNVMANLHFQNIFYRFEQKPEGNFAGAYLNQFEVDYNFLNPRVGVNVNCNEHIHFYGNVSMAQREPADNELYDTWDGPDDLGVAPLFSQADTVYHQDGSVDHIEWKDPQVEEEQVIDYELGVAYQNDMLQLEATLFWMDFTNEIIPSGQVNDDGTPIRGNADETVHRGIELSGRGALPYSFEWNGHVSFNDHYFEKFTEKGWGSETDVTGNTIVGSPDILAQATLAYRCQPFYVAAQLQHVGQQYLDNTENEDRTVEPYQLVNLNMLYSLKKWSFANFDLHVRVNNLLDQEYETAGYYDPWGGADWSGANYYWPGAGRNVSAGLRVRF